MFKKKSKEKTYKVIFTILSLCHSEFVAEFKSAEDAQEYCNFKNSTCEDSDCEWLAVIR